MSTTSSQLTSKEQKILYSNRKLMPELVIDAMFQVYDSQESYNLDKYAKCVVEVYFELSHESAEVIIAFGKTKVAWGEGECDDLTFRVTAEETHDNVWIRTKKFATFEFVGTSAVKANEVNKCVIEISSNNRICMSVNGDQLVRDLLITNFPRAGYIGLIGYREHKTTVKQLTLENVVFATPTLFSSTPKERLTDLKLQ